MPKHKPIKCKEFDIAKYSYTPLRTERVQFKSYPIYNYTDDNISNIKDRFVFQTGRICLVAYGIPKYNPSFKNNCNFIKLPLDPNQSKSTHLKKMLSIIDKYNDENDNKIKIFGKLAQSVDIVHGSSLVRSDITNDSDDDDDYIKKKMFPQLKYDYCKLKFSINHSDKSINTLVFIRENDKSRLLNNIKTVDDLRNYIKLGCHLKMIIMADRLWCNRSRVPDYGIRPYGVTLTIMQLEITPKPKICWGIQNNLSTYAFIDNPDDSDDSDDFDEMFSASSNDDKMSLNEITDDKGIEIIYTDCSLDYLLANTTDDYLSNMSFPLLNQISTNSITCYSIYHNATTFDKEGDEFIKVNICNECYNMSKKISNTIYDNTLIIIDI